MILVIEGANKVGKSTIIKSLQGMYGEENVVNVYERQGDDDILFLNCEKEDLKYINYAVGMSNLRYLEMLEKMYPEKLFILDRFHVTELVYGYDVRGYDATDTFKLLDDRLAQLKAKMIVVTSSYYHVHHDKEKAELIELQDMLRSKAQLSKLQMMFWEFTNEYELSSMKVLSYFMREIGWRD